MAALSLEVRGRWWSTASWQLLVGPGLTEVMCARSVAARIFFLPSGENDLSPSEIGTSVKRWNEPGLDDSSLSATRDGVTVALGRRGGDLGDPSFFFEGEGDGVTERSLSSLVRRGGEPRKSA